MAQERGWRWWAAGSAGWRRRRSRRAPGARVTLFERVSRAGRAGREPAASTASRSTWGRTRRTQGPAIVALRELGIEPAGHSPATARRARVPRRQAARAARRGGVALDTGLLGVAEKLELGRDPGRRAEARGRGEAGKSVDEFLAREGAFGARARPLRALARLTSYPHSPGDDLGRPAHRAAGARPRLGRPLPRRRLADAGRRARGAGAPGRGHRARGAKVERVSSRRRGARRRAGAAASAVRRRRRDPGARTRGGERARGRRAAIRPSRAPRRAVPCARPVSTRAGAAPAPRKRCSRSGSTGRSTTRSTLPRPSPPLRAARCSAGALSRRPRSAPRAPSSTPSSSAARCRCSRAGASTW